MKHILGHFASPTHQGHKAESKLMAVLCVPATRKTHSLLQAGRPGAGGAESGLRAAPRVKFSLGKQKHGVINSEGSHRSACTM